MAEAQDLTDQALKKLEYQLICPICFDTFKDPKLLKCNHVYCKDCLQQLPMVQGRKGQLSLCCPTCRQSTTTAADLSSLQTAFHILNLVDIQDAFAKVKDTLEIEGE